MRARFSTLFLLALGLAYAPPALAQGFGVKGGLALTSIGGDPAPGFAVEFSSETGGAGGIYYEARLNEAFRLRAELLYVRRSADGTGTANRPFGYLQADYLEIPVLASFDLSRGTTRPQIFTGPQIGFRLRESGRFEGPIDDLPQELESSVFGWAVGLGLEMPTSGGAFTLDARYVLGISDAFKASVRDGRRWNTWLFLAGYRF